MANASPVLYPSTESTAESELPTLVWRQRTLAIPARCPREPRPFPVDPVIELCVEGRLTGVQVTRNGREIRPEGTLARTAEVLDVNRQRVHRWTRTGLTANQADAIAIMFGLHPCLIWPNWFECAPGTEAELLEAERIAALWGGERGRTGPVPPAWAATEQRLIELRRQRVSARGMAETMMAEGRLTRGGSPQWNCQKVKDIFRHTIRVGVSA
jgi:hypothetical protein